jgi:hypothetical protein
MARFVIKIVSRYFHHLAIIEYLRLKIEYLWLSLRFFFFKMERIPSIFNIQLCAVGASDLRSLLAHVAKAKHFG